MARERTAEAEANTEAQTQTAPAGNTPPPPAPQVNDDRYKKVRVPVLNAEGQPTGEHTVKNRKDYILELYANKWGRGAIAKHLTELNSTENGGDGKKIPYQIVFAATKGKPGGPDKVNPGASAPAAEGQAS